MRPGSFSTCTGCWGRASSTISGGACAAELLDRRRGRGGREAAAALHRVLRRRVLEVLRRAARGVVGDDLEPEDVPDEVVLDRLHHRLEHVEALALPLGQRILLTHRAEVDALAEVVHLEEVLAPVLVDHREHHAPLDLAELLRADLLFLGVVLLERVAVQELEHRLGARELGDLVARDADREHVGREPHQLVDVPVLGELLATGGGGDDVVDRTLDRVDRLLAQVPALDDLLAALVDDLALLVHHLVVLEDVLADLEVAVLHRALRALDGLGDHLRLEGEIVGERLAHHPVHRARWRRGA